MMATCCTPFVTSEWLHSNSQVQVVDASWRFSPDGRSSSLYQEFLQERIPNSRYFDIEKAVTKDDQVPHLLPSPQQFASYVGTSLGISEKDTVVIYSRPHLVGAARVWWMFRVFGMPKDQCFILKGGIEDWKRHGYPLASGPEKSDHSKTFVPQFQPKLVAKGEQVKESKSGTALILDARSAGRFYGTEPEPRQGVPSGHIETACNLPFVQLLTKDGQDLLPKEDLMKVFESHGIDLRMKKNIICMCGSGVTATVAFLALDQLEYPMACVYDGSWMDWTMKQLK
ncbi:hypothetical protein GpartN1_g7378.t1 [Galdieria partita]|uniref:Rhodanese domain-containing protein n=1 Tax=Galdieria partita TaxID=83374 RepID=A0A9C7Q537_9RHOD|nr:hypothetical protein GpartN1_g7378.t1 [Galdieria partita]